MKEFLEIGEVVTTHSLTGEIKVYPWADSPEVLSRLEYLYIDVNDINAGSKSTLQVELARIVKNMVLLKIKGINSVEEARLLIGKILFVKRSDIPLPEGRHFVQDLLGLQVKNAKSDIIYGTIKQISNSGASDVYHVQNEQGEISLFPAVEEFIQEINVENGYVLINPIEGMFAENED